MSNLSTDLLPSTVKQYPAYPSYKPSGVEWLGDVPEHWTLRKLKFVASFIGGGTPSKDNPQYWDGEIPWVSPKDMKAETVDDVEEYITAEALAKSATRLVNSGSVLIVVRSGILKHSIPVAINTRPVALNQDLKAVLLNSQVLPEYFALLVRGNQKALLVEWRKGGATVESIEQELLTGTVIPIPPLAEQQAIAAFLDHETALIDELITLKEDLIEKLREYRATLISDAVTKGLDHDAPMKDSGIAWLGKIPAHWQMTRLKFVADLQTGLTLGKNYEDRQLITRPYLRVANVQDGYLDLEQITEVSLPYSEARRYELRYGDVLMTEGGDFDKLGRGYVWEGQIEHCLHQNHVFAVRPLPNLLEPQYLAALMTSWLGKTYFTSTSQQTTNLATTNSTKLMNFPFPLPSPNEQVDILTALSASGEKIDAIISDAENHIANLNEFRSALIAAAVTGRIDVRGDVA